MNRPIPLSEEGHRRRRPTIADVAGRAGVSPAAVSFAVNGRPGVGEQTRARILETAKELGWHPSASARALTEARARTIGLVLARQTEELEADSFFVRFLAGIERKLAAADYALLLHLVPVAGAEKTLGAYERLAAGGRVDGFLLTDPELEDPRLHLLQAAGLPVVVAGRLEPGSPFPWVETDHDVGMVEAVEHLVSLGHERIGFLGGGEAYEHVQRRLRVGGRPCRPQACRPGRWPTPAATATPPRQRCSPASPRRSRARATRSRWRSSPRLGARGLAVPDDLSVTGFDDSVLAALSSPTLTSVRVDYAEFGAAAAAALLARIDGERQPAYEPSRPVLEVRASTGEPGRAVSTRR